MFKPLQHFDNPLPHLSFYSVATELSSLDILYSTY